MTWHTILSYRQTYITQNILILSYINIYHVTALYLGFSMLFWSTLRTIDKDLIRWALLSSIIYFVTQTLGQYIVPPCNQWDQLLVTFVLISAVGLTLFIQSYLSTEIWNIFTNGPKPVYVTACLERPPPVKIHPPNGTFHISPIICLYKIIIYIIKRFIKNISRWDKKDVQRSDGEVR